MKIFPMIKLICSILFLICFTNSYAQEYRSVMIIPFDPAMYFSDSDEMLAKHNQKNIKEIRTLFRYGLNINLNARVMTQYETTNILSDTSNNSLNDLALIYKSISYFGDEPIPEKKEISEAEKKESKKIGNIFKKKEEDKTEQNIHQQQFKMPRKYINVKIKNKDLLPYLAEKYNVDLFLFANQFNLETNYEQCLDRANNIFQREVMVHYSLFDKNGKQLAGGITHADFPSNSNDMMDIMKSNFPKLTEQMVSQFPGKAPLRSIKEN